MKRLLPFAVLTMLSAVAAAQEPAERLTPPSIRVSGEASVIVQPVSTPVEPGTIEVRAAITLTVEIGAQ